MMENLSPGTKKVILGLLMLLMVYIAYVLSFRNAVAAVRLNGQLREAGTGDGEPSGAIGQLEREHDFYLNVLKGYRVRPDERESRLWQSVSGMAINTGTSISFSPEESRVLSDTSGMDSTVVFDSFTFSGEYGKLVKLLDTLSKAKGTGRIASARLSRETGPLGQEGKEKLVLKVKMAAVGR